MTTKLTAVVGMTIHKSKIETTTMDAGAIEGPEDVKLVGINPKQLDEVLASQHTSPVPHLSYSAIYTYFKSPRQFWDKYVNHTGFTSNLTFITGRAWHKALECYYKGYDDAAGPAIILLMKEAKELPEPPSVEEIGVIIERLTVNLDTYFAIKQDWTATDIELGVTCPSPTPNGLPLKGQMDITATSDKDGRGIVLDHKYVKKFAGKGQTEDEEGEKKGGKSIIYHYVQAWVYYHLYFHKYGAYPSEFRLAEFKQSTNRDGSPQYRETIVPYDASWLDKISAWYDDLCIQVVSQKRFVQNPFQMFDGEDWEEYLKS